jgi:pimeloyl-ACP methyl ester carboxylesterase
VANDVRAVSEHLSSQTGLARVSVLGASFSGGVCAVVAARHKDWVDRLVLFNPLLDYKKRFVDDKEYWSGDRIDAATGERLASDGYVAHSPTFRLGGALLNEVFWWDTRAELDRIVAPTLIVHGTQDTFIPVESSRAAVGQLRCRHQLLEIDGAQHGFAVHDDPGYADEQTLRWQSSVITETASWLQG